MIVIIMIIEISNGIRYIPRQLALSVTVLSLNTSLWLQRTACIAFQSFGCRTVILYSYFRLFALWMPCAVLLYCTLIFAYLHYGCRVPYCYFVLLFSLICIMDAVCRTVILYYYFRLFVLWMPCAVLLFCTIIFGYLHYECRVPCCYFTLLFSVIYIMNAVCRTVILYYYFRLFSLWMQCAVLLFCSIISGYLHYGCRVPYCYFILLLFSVICIMNAVCRAVISRHLPREGLDWSCLLMDSFHRGNLSILRTWQGKDRAMVGQVWQYYRVRQAIVEVRLSMGSYSCIKLEYEI